MHFRAASPASSAAAIHVTGRWFAQYAELLGTEELTLALSQPVSVAGALDHLRREHAGAAQLPEKPLVAVNLRHVSPDQRLTDGDELALLPPLAGG
jgi:molybdopterin converting factor small subunit